MVSAQVPATEIDDVAVNIVGSDVNAVPKGKGICIGVWGNPVWCCSLKECTVVLLPWSAMWIFLLP